MKQMMRSFVLAVVAMLSVTAFARTRTRVLLTLCDNYMYQTQILMFEVLEDGTWDYVRTFLHSFDGHCRIPMSAVVVDGTVFVLECAGYDNRDGDYSTAAARILKYDLEGNFLGVHVPEIKSWSAQYRASGDYLTFTPDKEWLIVGSMRYCSNPSLFKYSVATGAPLPNNGNQILGGLVGAYSFNVASDYTLPLTYMKDSTASGLNLYTNDMATAKWAKHETLYQLTQAKAAYIDESATPRRLFVGGYNAGYKVFEEGNMTPIQDHSGSTHICHFAKINGRMYVVEFDTTNIYMLDPTTFAEGTKALGNTVRKLYGNELKKLLSFSAYEETVADVAVEVAHWKFDEPVGSGVFTNSVSAKWPIRALNLKGGAVGVSGNAVCFNTKYARGVIGDSGRLLGSDYGVFFWICPEAANYLTYKTLISSRLEKNSCYWHFGFNNTTAAPWLYTKSPTEYGKTSTSALTSATWQHFGLVKKGTTLTFYLNGVQAGEWTGLTGLGGFDADVDYVLGADAHQNNHFLYNWNTGGAVFLDELRVFDGAPTAAQVAAIYGEHTAPAAPTAPIAPTLDKTVAQKYGTVVMHAFANAPAYTAPSIIYDAVAKRRWISCGTDAAATALDATTSFQYSNDGGTHWSAGGYAAPIARATLFQKDGVTYAFGRTVSDPATNGRKFSNGSYQTKYLDPTNECDISCGYQVVSVTDKAVLAAFTNGVNAIRFRDARADEADLVSPQALTAGTLALENGRYVQSYLLGGKVGEVSFAMDGEGRPVDFQATAATVEASAAFVRPRTDVPTDTLPGSDRPFAVRYDEKRECYWALTAPNGTALELYATKDGAEWTKTLTVFTVEDAATTRVSNPAFDIAGFDLAVAFTLCCPDGGAPTVDLDSPNFVMSRTVERFRQYCPWKPGLMMIVR